MDSPHPASRRSAISLSEQGDPGAVPGAGGGDRPSAGAADGAARDRSGTARPPTWMLVARLVRPHGRHGELIAEILTDFPERFSERKLLFLIPPERIGTPAREMVLEHSWPLRNRMVLKFAGIDSINEADSLRGYDVGIPFAERAEPGEGSVYIGDLIGCRVIDLNRGGATIGEIVDVDRNSSSADLLVVRREEARKTDGEAVIPFVRAYVVRIDLAGRSVEMRLPEGLLEINAPMTEEEKRESREEQ